MKQIRAFKYCPRCGNNFENLTTHLKCASCELSFYINPKPCTAVVLVNNQDEYLLVERAVEPAKGYWDLPGGFVEENETFEENTAREVKEELGIIINKETLHYIGSVTELYKYQGIDYPTLAAVFIARMPRNAQLRPADDVASYRFFSPDNLPMGKLAFEHMSIDLETADKFLKSNEL
ncbi:NUDIX domain-containing protein [Candidatus Saccharibacteria bacterium]|nr:NUDIX domain-containing protein [Candidatus Saccharibacteria bacterium]